MVSRTLAIIFFLGIFSDVTIGQSAVTVETEKGPISGQLFSGEGYSLFKFLGVPYAKPPTGGRRFLPPEELDPWTTPVVTTAAPPSCVQPMYQAEPDMMGNPQGQSEDCLHLNIHAPAGVNLPVMVWIHGGGLTMGTSSIYDADVFSLTENAVVVTINYRLGVYGFLATGDNVVEGNAGFLDQVLALRWVRDNIAKFGGDPGRITIFGESAGGWSVSAHLVSPLSRGLFHRAICQSGALLGLKMESHKQRGEKTMKLAESLSCPTSDSSAALSCLQRKSLQELEAAVNEEGYLPLSPATIGGSFLPTSLQSLYEGLPSAPEDAIQIMMGFNSMEGLDILTELTYAANASLMDYLRNGISMDDPIYHFMTQDTANTFSPSDKVGEKLAPVLIDQFTDDKSSRFGVMRGLIDMAGYLTFIGPSMRTMQILASKQYPVYLYYFDQIVEPNEFATDALLPIIGYTTQNPKLPLGANHAAEIAYVFGWMSENGPFPDMVSEGDRSVGLSMRKSWGSFARSGSPTFTADDGSEEPWPVYDNGERSYLEFKHPMSEDSIKKDFNSADVNFLTKLMPAYIKYYENMYITSKKDNSKSNSQPEDEVCEKSVSTISRTTAETALFILCAVVVVLLLLSLILIANYCSMKKALKKEAKENSYEIRSTTNTDYAL